MFNKLLICLLLIFCGAYADNGWSVPKLLSQPTRAAGSYPYIVVDKTSKLYAFWSTTGHRIFYRTSSDFGQSWSNIDSTLIGQPPDAPILPIIVFDSNNNLYLFYQYYYSSKLIYQKMVNGVWGQPQVLEDYAGSGIKVVIDENDNIYIFWLRQGIGNFFYKIMYADGSCSAIKVVNNRLQWDICYNGDENIFIAGSNESLLISPTNKAYHLNYSTKKDSIIQDIDISYNLRPSQSFAIACSQTGRQKIHTALNVGAYGDTATTWYCNQNGNSWQIPEKIKGKTYFRNKQLIVDGNSNPHLFDMSLLQDTLYHFSKTGTVWSDEKVVWSPDGAFNWVAGYKALIVNDYICLVYIESLTSHYYHLYFKKKKINVGIDDENLLPVTNYELGNYPNPFNNTTLISFVLPQISKVKLEVFNAKGELVQSLNNCKLKSGKHTYYFYAAGLNSGVYYCRLTADSDVKTTKLMLIK